MAYRFGWSVGAGDFFCHEGAKTRREEKKEEGWGSCRDEMLL